MQVIKSNIDVQSEAFRQNAAAQERVLAELAERQAKVRAGGSERAVQKHLAAGKLLPRERVELLLDPGAPFLELSTLAAWGMYSDESPGAGIITGIGVVSDTLCMIIANEATVKGGTSYPVSVEKSLRAQEIAQVNRLPCVYLVESGGANLPHQADLFVEGGRGFCNQARMSAQGIPQISLVFGSSTAGGAYIPGLSDYTVLVRDQAMVFLGGPPLVKMATGEVVDEESLGGAAMHARVSGLADYLANDDADALRIGRALVAQLHRPKPDIPGLRPPEPPAYDAAELPGLLPLDMLRQPLDMREILARLLDASHLLEFKPDYGATLVCGTGHLGGFPIGVIANNGILFPDSANKAAQFIQLCNQARTPLLYLQNISGFMVGRDYEQAGIVKHGSKMINAVANSSVPQFTVLIGGSYGAGNYAMCGRAFDPRLLLAWPTSRIAVMGAEQAAGVLAIVQEEAARKRGQEPDADQIALLKAMTMQKFEQESDPYYATARLWDDGLIDPRHTRDALILGLSMSYNRDWVREGAPHYGVFRM